MSNRFKAGDTVYFAWVDFHGTIEVVSTHVTRAGKILRVEDRLYCNDCRISLREDEVAATREEALEKLRDRLRKERAELMVKVDTLDARSEAITAMLEGGAGA